MMIWDEWVELGELDEWDKLGNLGEWSAFGALDELDEWGDVGELVNCLKNEVIGVNGVVNGIN